MLELTGERFLPWMEGAQIHYEHLHRYAFATQFVKGKKVIDLACGEGYGTYMLAKEAEYAVGVEIDEQTVRHARGRYLRDNLQFIQGSIVDIPIEGKEKFDVAVCFEGIEHITEHDRLLSEVKRLLKNDGLFIVSTPNKAVYTDAPGYHNPFHVKELYIDEFRSLLERYFKHVHLWGQRVYAGSNIWSLHLRKPRRYIEAVIKKGDREFYFAERNSKEPMYFVALASNARLEPSLSSIDSWLVDVSNAFFEAQIQQIQRGIVMQLVSRYQRAVEKLLRPGTRRRYYYELALTGIRVILNEGWRSFWSKFRRWVGQSICLGVAFPIARRRPWISKLLPALLKSPSDYLEWLDYNRVTYRVVDLIKAHIESFTYKPKFSIIMAVFNPPIRFLHEAIKSVRSQIYSNWELCICDNGSNSEVESVLKSYAKTDDRIKVCSNPTNMGISEGLNAGLKLATGEFIGLLDHDDVLEPTALYYVSRTLNENPELDMIYTDRDLISENGVRFDPFFKPDWSPHTILSHNYVIHFLVFRAKLLEQVGKFRKEFDGAQDYDMILRLSEVTTKIAHIPRPLYSWRRHLGSSSMTPKLYAYGNAEKAIKEALHRRGLKATVTRDNITGPYQVFYDIKGKPLVSIIISCWDVQPYLQRCLTSIIEKSTYTNYEIIVTSNNPDTSSLADFCAKNKVRLCACPKNFFYSAQNNKGADLAQGDFLLFLNDDTEVLTPDWIEKMLCLCQLPEVGAVGPMLIAPNGRIQYTYSVSHLARDGNFYHFSPHSWFNSESLYGFSSKVISNVSSVSGACMMVKRQLFSSVGGFDTTDFPLAFQDIDFCYKLADLGLYNIYTPYARLIHYGAGTKRYLPDYGSDSIYKPDLTDAYKFCKKYESRLLAGDAFFNRNLCGLGALISPPALLVYDELPDPHDATYFTNYGFPMIKKREAIEKRKERLYKDFMPVAEKIVHTTNCKKVIDIGCGLAELVEAFQNLGIYAVGVEASAAACTMVPETIRNFILRCSVADSNFLRLLAQRGWSEFDVALAFEILEHIPERKVELAIANIGALADIVVITTPKPNLWDNNDPTHVCIKPAQFWRNKFSAVGFEVDQLQTAALFGPNDLERNQDSTRLVFRRK